MGAVVTGGRRRFTDAVVARPVVRVFAVALVFIALGNLISLSCIIGWLRQLPGDDASAAIIMFSAAAVAQLVGATAALLGWAWSR